MKGRLQAANTPNTCDLRHAPAIVGVQVGARVARRLVGRRVLDRQQRLHVHAGRLRFVQLGVGLEQAEGLEALEIGVAQPLVGLLLFRVIVVIVVGGVRVVAFCCCFVSLNRTLLLFIGEVVVVVVVAVVAFVSIGSSPSGVAVDCTVTNIGSRLPRPRRCSLTATCLLSLSMATYHLREGLSCQLAGSSFWVSSSSWSCRSVCACTCSSRTDRSRR